MNDKLTQRPLPCPFGCDSKPYAAIFNDGTHIAIFCPICETEGPVHDTETKALAAWNTRAISEPKQAPVDKEGWLTKSEIKAIRRGDLSAEQIPPLCRMALYALNGPPAVDPEVIRKARLEGAEAVRDYLHDLHPDDPKKIYITLDEFKVIVSKLEGGKL